MKPAIEPEPNEAWLQLGDDSWHAGAGWYYWDREYPDEGSVGAFATKAEAIEHAKAAEYTLITEHP